MRMLILGLLLVGCGAQQVAVPPAPVATPVPVVVGPTPEELKAKAEAEAAAAALEADRAEITTLVKEAAEEVENDRAQELPPGAKVTIDVVEVVFADDRQASIAVLKLTLLMGKLKASEVYVRFFLVKGAFNSWTIRTAMPRVESMLEEEPEQNGSKL